VRKLIYLLSYIKHATKTTFRFLFHGKKNKRIVLLATPTHGNLGDQAIVFAEKKMLASICPDYSVIEVENGAYRKCKGLVQRFVKETDIIVIDGGGNLGTIWPVEDDKITDIISTFRQNKIVIFPQTAFYDASDASNERIEKNRAAYAHAKDLTVLLRDMPSFDLFTSNFSEVDAALCPDIVLSLEARRAFERNGILLCLRSDREKVISEGDVKRLEACLHEQGLQISYTDTVLKKSVRNHNRRRELRKKWSEFSRARLVVTDRLHAMIFAYITGTPCIAINNSSKKVEGSFHFIKDCGFIKMADSVWKAAEMIPECMNMTLGSSGGFEYPINIIETIFSSAKTYTVGKDDG